MNLRDLQYLVAVAEHRHFGKAAEASYVSQPTLSTQIKKLEQELGVELIEQNPRHIMLTDAGERVVERARVILGEAESIRNIARRAADPESGSVRMGLFPTLAPYLLPHVVPQLHARFPNLELLLVEEKTEVVLQRLRDGQLDVGVLAMPVHDVQLHAEPLFEEDFVLAVPADHPLAASDGPVDTSVLADENVLLLEEGHCLRDQALAVCHLAGAAERSGFRATSLETLRQMVAAGVGITLLPELAVKPPVPPSDDIRLLRFREPVPRREIAMFWRRTSVYADFLPRLAEVVRDLPPELTREATRCRARAACDNRSVAGDDITERLRAATELLETVGRDRALLDALTPQERARLLTAAGDVFEPDVEARRQQGRARRRRERDEKRDRDEEVLAGTGIRRLRARPVFTTPNVFPPEDFAQADIAEGGGFREVVERQHCYVCKDKYTKVHHFYDQLCPPCAELNWTKRTETTDLHGRVALLTGGRVKIGYQAGIKLLRAGCELIVTTRFPRDAATRFAAAEDFEDWGHRLAVFGLDLRHTPSVEAFCDHLLATRKRLDFIVNNACQTVRRPPDFYRHMLELESAAEGAMPARVRALLGEHHGLRGVELVGPAALSAGPLDAPALSQVPLLPEEHEPRHDLFPEGRLDQDLQQVDLRDRNSWRLTLAEVSSIELLETQLVNAVAPFVLNARLKPLLLRVPGHDKHIVNVSAVEGQFYRRFKTTKHPHTNMAKAALNMMTRTSATDYHADGIHMNSVDTGWVSDEDPVEIAEQKRAEHRFHPPLDIVDGAARIVDPIISGFNAGRHVHGQFLKDYLPTDW